VLQQTVEALLESGYSLIKEHQLIIETSVWHRYSFSDCGLKKATDYNISQTQVFTTI
jgi:hypothetical protein